MAFDPKARFTDSRCFWQRKPCYVYCRLHLSRTWLIKRIRYSTSNIPVYHSKSNTANMVCMHGSSGGCFFRSTTNIKEENDKGREKAKNAKQCCPNIDKIYCNTCTGLSITYVVPAQSHTHGLATLSAVRFLIQCHRQAFAEIWIPEHPM